MKKSNNFYEVDYLGTVRWYIRCNGHLLLHREDGPAVIYNNDNEFWYLNGFGYSLQEFNIYIALKKAGYDDSIIKLLLD